METPTGNLTLRALAREAGVSVATLDRVLHGRAGVRPDTARRVREAIERHDLRGPSHDSAPLRALRFAFVMPDGENVFMRMILEHVDQMSAWLAARRIAVETVLTDVFNPSALIETLERLSGRFEGVAVVALDHQGVRAAIDDLVDAGVFVVTLVSDVPASRRHHYVGIDNFAAGRTAATLIGRLIGARPGEIAVVAGSLSLRDHAERVFGFNQLMSLEHGHLTVLGSVEGGDQDARNYALTTELLAEYPNLVGVYIVGAGAPGVLGAIGDARRRLVVVAHDLTEFCRRALLRGALDAAIVQEPGHEARSAIRVLLALARGERILSEQEKIRIDIVMRDNLP